MITLQLTGTTLYAKNSDGGSITGMAPTPPSIKGDMPLVELTGGQVVGVISNSEYFLAPMLPGSWRGQRSGYS